MRPAFVRIISKRRVRKYGILKLGIHAEGSVQSAAVFLAHGVVVTLELDVVYTFACRFVLTEYQVLYHSKNAVVVAGTTKRQVEHVCLTSCFHFEHAVQVNWPF